ncbi:DUF6907 domain-containing protein [Streptomyces ardesiacus]|uniref:DUF6907 domain-containing protein n=1 Tax=Streptomyces ardesiacus TaxID=285564 RepID=A0ABW8H6Y8_9ACTN
MSHLPTTSTARSTHPASALLDEVQVPVAQSAAGTNNAPAVAVRPGYRLVPALVGKSTEPGSILYVECPDWCVVDHVADRNVFIQDISHQGEKATLSLTPTRGEQVPLEVYLSEWPALAEDNGQPRLDVDIDSEVYSYGRTAAMALADQMVAFAEDVRRLAETLPEEAQA